MSLAPLFKQVLFRSISKKYSADLEDLLKTLNQCHLHYIRCLACQGGFSNKTYCFLSGFYSFVPLNFGGVQGGLDFEECVVQSKVGNTIAQNGLEIAQKAIILHTLGVQGNLLFSSIREVPFHTCKIPPSQWVGNRTTPNSHPQTPIQKPQPLLYPTPLEPTLIAEKEVEPQSLHPKSRP